MDNECKICIDYTRGAGLCGCSNKETCNCELENDEEHRFSPLPYQIHPPQKEFALFTFPESFSWIDLISPLFSIRNFYPVKSRVIENSRTSIFGSQLKTAIDGDGFMSPLFSIDGISKNVHLELELTNHYGDQP